MKKTNLVVLLVLLVVALSLTVVALLIFLRPRGPTPVIAPAPAIPSSPLFSEADLRLAQTLKSNPVQKVLSGNGASVSYTQELAKGDVIVGHAFRFQHASSSTVFLMTGPGAFEFSISSGLWYKHTNTTARLNEALLQGQIDIMVNKYHVKPESLKIVRMAGDISKRSPSPEPGTGSVEP